MWKFNKEGIRKVISYGVVGVIGTIVHFATLVILVEVFGRDPISSSLIGFILTVIISYILNKTYTFQVKNKKDTILFLKYAAVSVTGFVMNYLIMYLTVEIFTIHYAIGQTIVVVCIPVTNFLLNNYWAFK